MPPPCAAQVGNDFLPPLPTVDINEGGAEGGGRGLHAAAPHSVGSVPSAWFISNHPSFRCCPSPSAGSLDAMFALYKQLLPQMGGYLTHAGELNRGRLETFMRHLAEAEADVLHARAEVGAGRPGSAASSITSVAAARAVAHGLSTHALS